MNTEKEPGQAWERELVTELARSALVERRRTRRWGIFFKLLTFAYLASFLVLLWPDDWGQAAISKKSHSALVNLSGVIAPGELAGADKIAEGLRDAFEDENTKGVILRINSPGGSPVQSNYIYKEIKRLREKYPDTPLYAVVSDLCASGGYYVASAADKIFVNESSIVGSIGVIMSSFGFVDTLDKLGIERRLMTAGEHKGILDPFSPIQDFDQTHLQALLDSLHRDFIDSVREGRGDRLADREEIFSGLFWSGKESVELGLADDFASAGQVAREVIGEEEIVDFTPKEDVWERLASRFGAGIASALAQIGGLNQTPGGLGTVR
jgi:protease-4